MRVYRRLLIHTILVLLALAGGISAQATITIDGQSQSIQVVDKSRVDWTHTSSGSPEGVLVFCIQAGSGGVSNLLGATYDGEGMTEINTATDTGGETGYTRAYFMGSGVSPATSVTVSCVGTANANFYGLALTVQASGNLKLAGTGSCIVQTNVANPSCTITGIAGASWAAAGIFTGIDSLGSITAGSGFTLGPMIANGGGLSQSASVYSTTQQASGNQVVSFTIPIDDVAMVAVALEEGAGAQPTPGTMTKDANGFTVVTPAADSRLIYVKTAGSDAADGLSPATAKQTIAAGVALLRYGWPDQLLLNRGDTFDETISAPVISGRGPQEPALISSFGAGARPFIKKYGNGIVLGDARNVAVIGLVFHNTKRDPSHADYDPTATLNTTGLSLDRGDTILFEDVFAGFHTGGAVFDSPTVDGLRNLTLRRSVLYSNYANVNCPCPPAQVSHAQNFHCTRIDGLLLEDNVVDHGGWIGNDRSISNNAGGPTIFNHNLYIQGKPPGDTSKNVVVQGNIVANASSHGIQLRPGGIAYNNLWIDNPLNTLFGISDVPLVSTTATYNVADGSADVTPSLPRGTAFGFTGVEPIPIGAYLDHNLAIHDQTSNSSSFGLNNSCLLIGIDDVSCGGDPCPSLNCPDSTITNNIWFDWPRGCQWVGQAPPGSIGNFVSQTIENNIYSDPTGCTASGTNKVGATFYDDTRRVSTYDSVVLGGPGTNAHFLQLARANSKDNWDPHLTAAAANAWIREGFFGSPSLKGGSVRGGSIK